MKLSLWSVRLAACTAFAVSLSAQAPPPPPPPPPPGANTFFFTAKTSVDEKVVKNAPYSGTSVTTLTQTLANGTHIVQNEQSTLARDSAGRTRREESLQNIGPWSTAQAPKTLIFISDPVANVQYLLEPDSQTATKMAFIMPDGGSARGQKLAAEAMTKKMVIVSSGVSTSAVSASGASAPGPVVTSDGGVVSVRRSEGQANGNVETLPDQVIEGLTVHGKRTTATIAAGTMGNDQPIVMTTETWYSPDLQMVVLSKHSDPRIGDTVTALTGVSRAEPAASLFQVPAGYTIKESEQPSEVHFDIQKDRLDNPQPEAVPQL